MTKTKKLTDRACKISISLDRETLDWLDSLDGERSSNIRNAIANYRTKQEQVSYSKFLRQLKHRERD